MTYYKAAYELLESREGWRKKKQLRDIYFENRVSMQILIFQTGTNQEGPIYSSENRMGS